MRYNPPNGTPPIPAAESDAYSKLADTCVNVIYPVPFNVPANDPAKLPVPEVAWLDVVAYEELNAVAAYTEYEDVTACEEDITPIKLLPSPEKLPVTGEDPVKFNEPDIVMSYALTPDNASVTCVICAAVILPPSVIPLLDILLAIFN